MCLDIAFSLRLGRAPPCRLSSSIASSFLSENARKTCSKPFLSRFFIDFGFFARIWVLFLTDFAGHFKDKLDFSRIVPASFKIRCKRLVSAMPPIVVVPHFRRATRIGINWRRRYMVRSLRRRREELLVEAMQIVRDGVRVRGVKYPLRYLQNTLENFRS